MSDEKRSEDESKDDDDARDSSPSGEDEVKTKTKAKAKSKDDDDEADGEEPSSSKDDDDDDDEDDRPASANPEAIARRVAALGEDDDAVERVAREEERKLAERRAALKGKKKKKGGLEVAASKKLSKIGRRAEPKRSVAVAADADPLIERTAKLSEWARKNQKTVQLVGGAIAIGLLGTAGYLYYDKKRETDASVILSKAVADQHARIGEAPKDDDDDNNDPYYKTYDDRRKAALGKYREVQSKFSGTGAAILSRLAEGSLLLDMRDADGAMQAYNDVKATALAAADSEVKGRALEGIGFAYELKAQKAPAEAQKHLDDALKAYRELENLDVKGLKEMAMYHQARVLANKGEKDKAKELLLSLKERLNKTDDSSSNIPTGPTFPYLREMAMDRLREIDPSAAPKTGGMPGGGAQLTPAQIRKMMEDMQKKGAGGHGH